MKTNLDGENSLNQDSVVLSPSPTGEFHIHFTSKKSFSQVGAVKTDYIRGQHPVALMAEK